MKKYLTRVAVLSLFVLGFNAMASSQIIVKIRPAAPVVVHTACPSPRHVWIDGGWVVRGGRYMWTDGYWVVPRRGYHYAPGYWSHRRSGYVWVPGHWAKRRR